MSGTWSLAKRALLLLGVLAVMQTATAACGLGKVVRRAAERLSDTGGPVLPGDPEGIGLDPLDFPPVDAPPQISPSQIERIHPRLFFTAGDVEALRSSAPDTHREMAQSVKRYTDDQVGGRQAFGPGLFAGGDLDAYRDAGDALIALALACVVGDEPATCDLARSRLVAVSDWPEWGENGERGLGLSHMLQGTALAYDWLYPRLTVEEQLKVRGSLAAWTQKMYEASAATEVVDSWNNWWHSAYLQNHYAIANSALGLAGLALLGEDDRAETWVNHAVERMSRLQYMLDGIGDGSWHEGISYQTYALTQSLPFLTQSRAVAGIDLFPHTYLQAYTYWRLYNYLPGTTQFILPIGDFEWTYLGTRSPTFLRFLAREYHDSHAEWLAQQLIAVGARRNDARSAAWTSLEFLLYDPDVAPIPPIGLPAARVFPDLEGVIWRSGWGAGDLVFGLKTGPYGGRFGFNTFVREAFPWQGPCLNTGCQLSMGHDHADANSFYLFQSGTWLVSEAAQYGDHETSSHNTILIDGEGQAWPRQRERRMPAVFAGMDAFIADSAGTEGFDYVAADASGMYGLPGDLQTFTRHVLFVRPDYLFMLDDLSAKRAHAYQWVGHFALSGVVEGDWVKGTGLAEQVVGIQVLSPQPFRHEEGNDGLPYVRIQPEEAAAGVRFINLILPTTQNAWASRPQGTLLEDGGAAAVVRVQWGAGRGRADDLVVNYGPAPSASIVASYELDGRIAVVSRGAGGELQRLFVYGGTFLKDLQAGHTLVACAPCAGAVEAIYEGETLAVSGAIPNGLTLYAPAVGTVLVNGQSQPFSRQGDYILIGDR